MRELHQVAQAEHARRPRTTSALLVEAELGGEHAAVERRHARADLEADDRREAAVAQLRLDHRQQIVGLLLVALGVGVARDAEQLAGVDLHAGEQQVEVVRHDVLERHEACAVADAQEARDAARRPAP